jgi:hypothetical protein
MEGESEALGGMADWVIICTAQHAWIFLLYGLVGISEWTYHIYIQGFCTFATLWYKSLRICETLPKVEGTSRVRTNSIRLKLQNENEQDIPQMPRLYKTLNFQILNNNSLNIKTSLFPRVRQHLSTCCEISDIRSLCHGIQRLPMSEWLY